MDVKPINPFVNATAILSFILTTVYWTWLIFSNLTDLFLSGLIRIGPMLFSMLQRKHRGNYLELDTMD
jgi:hypothetical protein